MLQEDCGDLYHMEHTGRYLGAYKNGSSGEIGGLNALDNVRNDENFSIDRVAGILTGQASMGVASSAKDLTAMPFHDDQIVARLANHPLVADSLDVANQASARRTGFPSKKSKLS
jgi:hypothetical protein